MPVMRLRRPCCDSVRSCAVTAIYVHDVVTGNVVRRVDAVRCYRLGYIPGVAIEYDPQRHLIYYLYISNRGNPWIKFYHIPPSLDESSAREFVLKAHGLA
jgi:hypothetical protein